MELKDRGTDEAWDAVVAALTKATGSEDWLRGSASGQQCAVNTIERLAAQSARGETVCWMLERNFDGQTVYWDGGHADSYTNDPNEGIKFSDHHSAFWATRFTFKHGNWNIREHIFLNAALSSTASKEGQ